MATKQLTDKQKQNKFIKALTENEGEADAPTMVQLTGLPKAEVKTIAEALVAQGVIESAGKGLIRLVEEEEEVVVAPPKKGGKKAAPVVEDDDDDDFDMGEAGADDDDDGFGLEDEDEGQDGDDDGQDGDDDAQDDDDEEEAPAPKKGKKGAKGPVPPHKQFSLAFKPIDTLTDEELEERIDMGVAAAESLAGQDHTLVAELIMRTVAKCRRQVKKRS